jgi:DNA-nicking Smr family endonuclease
MTSDPRRPASRKKRVLTDEDVALWSHVTRGVEPTQGKRRIHPALDDVPDGGQPSTPPPQAGGPAPVPRVSAAHVPRPIPVKPLAPVKPNAPQGIARRQVRKLAGGHTEIDARIDLHGMRQDEAFGALRRFLTRCFASGHRHVLIITGKGGAPVREESEPWGSRERGVLKRNVPRWLAEPELSSIVVSHTVAHARHGGEGALYVVLRNARKHRDR